MSMSTVPCIQAEIYATVTVLGISAEIQFSWGKLEFYTPGVVAVDLSHIFV
jgi:hypothetical protein